MPAGAKVAAVTTQIYQASTERDLDRVAKQFGVTETFTAGNPSDPNVVAKRTPATYLSEVLRTLRAAVNDVEAKNNTTPEQITERASRIRAGISDAWKRSGQLNKALDQIDRENRHMSESTEHPDGSVTVREASGREWAEYSGSGGLHYMGPDDQVGYYTE